MSLIWLEGCGGEVSWAQAYGDGGGVEGSGGRGVYLVYIDHLGLICLLQLKILGMLARRVVCDAAGINQGFTTGTLCDV